MPRPGPGNPHNPVRSSGAGDTLVNGNGSGARIIDRSTGAARAGLTAGRGTSSSGRARRPSLVGLASIGIVLVVLLSALAFIALTPSGTSAARTARGPIVIVSDAAFTTENGVVSGSGTPANPYVISGWEIPVDSGSAITVTGTTAHFVITDVRLNGTASYTPPAYLLSMTDVSNATVSYSVMNDTDGGIVLDGCRDISIVRDEFTSIYGWAIHVISSDRVNVLASSYLCAAGVWMEECSSGAVVLNEMAGVEIGINLWACDDVIAAENVIPSATSYGITGSGCSNMTVMGNTLEACTFAIDITACENTTVLANEVNASTASGIFIDQCTKDVLVAHNLVNWTHGYCGVVVDTSSGVVVRDNILANNTAEYSWFCEGGGVYLHTSTGITVYNNSFIDNLPLQAEDTAGIHVNHWNLTYPGGGNYWHEWTEPDLCSGSEQDDSLAGPDGFVDLPYDIDGDTADGYPLTDRPALDTKPVAVVEVRPSSGDISTLFELNASGSYDPDDGCGDPLQEYRWDLDGNGSWDSDWSDDGNITWQYTLPGNYTVLIEVRDGSGLSGFAFVDLVVSEYAIPEFGAIVVPVLAMVGLFAVIARARRSRA